MDSGQRPIRSWRDCAKVIERPAAKGVSELGYVAGTRSPVTGSRVAGSMSDMACFCLWSIVPSAQNLLFIFEIIFS